eukprot:Sspe_Gene.15319::Locus_5332_Transcript_1_2_Confidence_0.800_Length_1649::g.15319::m.15319
MGVISGLFKAAWFAAAIALLAFLVGRRRPAIPEHLLNHPYVTTPDILTEEEAQALLEATKEMELPTNANDLAFYETRHEHIGEAIPMPSDGSCGTYLVPSKNKSLCVLPGRIDVARHFITSGGYEGLKEPFDILASRVQSFGRYIFNYSSLPIAVQLMSSEKFLSAAKAVCPPHQQHLDPFQLNLIVQVPGQSVAAHVDAVYFWGATRFDFPQWLLAVMVFSGLWKEQFVNQVQVVGYYHKWSDPRDGSFVWWNTPSPTPLTSDPLPRLGLSVDGSKSVHAAAIYQSKARPPKIDKSKRTVLRFVGDDTWEVAEKGTPDKVLQTYTTDDLRLSVVYRARCFENEQKAQEFSRMEHRFELEEVLETLRKDMVEKGLRSPTKGIGNTPEERYQFATDLLDAYIKYPPSPKALLPNYCLLPKLWPSLSWPLSWLC